MAEQGKGLNDEQRRARAEMLEGPPVGAAAAGEASAMPNRCASAPLGNPLTGPRWNGWGAGLANTRFQPAAAAGLTASQVPALTLKWAFGFPGSRSAYQQPTVASGRVYAGADTGFVHSLDAGSGCVQLVVPRAGRLCERRSASDRCADRRDRATRSTSAT
jgi:polyvinyl alcohol dehydrogenase (cytochrome)